MKQLKLLLLVGCILSVYSQEDVKFSVKNFIEDLKKPNNWGVVEKYLDSGPMNNFFDYDTTIEIYKYASIAFPDIVKQPIEIGKSFLNNSMYAIALTLKKDNLNDCQAVLIDSLHHGREMLSLSMQIYTFAKLVSDYQVQDQAVIDLLQTTVIWFIPAVNVDGLVKVKDIINNQYQRDYVRKNYNRSNKCYQQGGVDLNRNYDDHFGYDEEGSSNNECQEDYRGEHAFSEPETQNIKKFIEERKNIKIAFNLHSFGNMWIRPINYLGDVENKLLEKMHREYHVYKEFDEEAQFIKDTKKGNAFQVFETRYVANGEATDWMLLKKKIIAMSPEIGDEQTNFFPQKHQILVNLQSNYPPINYMMQKILFSPKLQRTAFLNKDLKTKFIKKHKIKPQLKNTKLKVLTIEIFNSGIGDLLQEDQLDSFIELGFQRDFSQKKNSSIETGNPDDRVQTVEEDQNNTISTNSTNKFHNFHIQNVYYIDYSEDYRFGKLQENGMDELNSQILDFNLHQTSFNKTTSPHTIIEMRFKNKFSTYQIPFNTSFEGRTFRKYFVVFTTPLTPNDKILFNIRIIAGFGKNENKKVFNLQQSPINIDFDGVNNAEVEELDDPKLYETDEYPYYYSVILLLTVILMCLVLKVFKRKREQDMTRFANEMSAINNQIEIN